MTARGILICVSEAWDEIRDALRTPFSVRMWRHRLYWAFCEIAQIWRWPAAHRLNEQRPRRYCWSTLCMWALGYGWDRSEGFGRCIEDAKKDGCCYCGAIQCPQRLRDQGMDASGLNSDTFV